MPARGWEFTPLCTEGLRVEKDPTGEWPLHKQAQRDVNRKALRAQQPFHPCNLSWDHDGDRDGSIHSWGAAVNPKPQPQGDCCHSRASSSCGCATVSLRALWMTWHQHIQPAGTGLASEGCAAPACRWHCCRVRTAPGSLGQELCQPCSQLPNSLTAASLQESCRAASTGLPG